MKIVSEKYENSYKHLGEYLLDEVTGKKCERNTSIW